MNAEHIQVVFAVITLVAIVALTIRRWSYYAVLRDGLVRRLVLVDLLLLIAALEFAADALADALGDQGNTPIRFVAIILRGSLAACSLGLLASFPGSGREIVS